MPSLNELQDAAEAREKQFRAPYFARMAAAEQRRDDWGRRWYLSLAVGNGAGAAGLTSAVVNVAGKMGAPPAQLLLPGLWCFAIGLLAAGVIPILRSLAAEQDRAHAEVGAYAFQDGDAHYHYVDEDTPELTNTGFRRHWKAKTRYETATRIVQIIAAIGVAAGVLAPLAALTWWYVARQGA